MHHLDYEFDRKPWDYPDAYMITLCEKCHLCETENRKTNEAELLKAMRLAKCDAYTLRRLAVFFRTELGYYPEVVTSALLKIATDREFHDQFFRLYFDSLAKENAMRKEKPPKNPVKFEERPPNGWGRWIDWVRDVTNERIGVGSVLSECFLVDDQNEVLLIFCPTDYHLAGIKRNRKYLENTIKMCYGQSWKIATTQD